MSNMANVDRRAQIVAQILFPRPDEPRGRASLERAAACLHGAALMSDSDSDSEVWLSYLSETCYELGWSAPA